MPTFLESNFMSKDDDELLEIAHSEDYRPDAQQVAKALLIRRGLPTEMLEERRDPTADFTPEPWALGKSESDLRRMFKRRRLMDKIIFWLLIALGIFSIYRTLLAFVLYYADRGVADLGAAALFYFFLIYLWSFSLWYLCLVRPLLHTVFYWRTPLQILLLRPFEFPKSRERTRRFARNYLRYLGHTYTLSDAEVQPRIAFLESLRFFLPLFSLWLTRAFRSYYKVKRDEYVTGLKEFISRRFVRNIAWVLSWDKLFKISCTPQTWKRTAQHLINSAQLIVVDLSHAGEGLKWELDEIRFYHATGKIVFVCYEDSLGVARTILESCGWPGGRALEVFAYGNEGLASRHDELIGKLASTAASFLQVDKTPK